MSEERVAVYISRSVYDAVRRMAEESGEFSNVDEFVEFVLREFLEGGEEAGYTPEEEEKIKERLRSLGYL